MTNLGAMAPADESNAPLPRLTGLVTKQISDELLRRLRAAGFTDARPAHNSVFPHVPPEGIRLVDLADRAGMTKQAMSELVADLEGLGYLQRRPDPADGRAKLIEFTDRGWASVRTALAAFEAIEAELVAAVGAGRMRQLRRTLLAVLEATNALPSS
jgi:DNA-binding MarR family transcriptional regulator